MSRQVSTEEGSIYLYIYTCVFVLYYVCVVDEYIYMFIVILIVKVHGCARRIINNFFLSKIIFSGPLTDFRYQQ